MPELKKSLLTFDRSAAVRRIARSLILLVVGVILGTLIVVGQQEKPVTKKQIPVSDRIENVIKAKEPRFKLAGKHFSNNQEQKYVLLGWQSGEDVVSSTSYELASAQEAKEMLHKSLNGPMSVPLQTTKLTEIGDEAYMSTSNYSKEGHTNLLFCKENYFIVMSATSPDLAQRFAKHMAMGIDN